MCCFHIFFHATCHFFSTLQLCLGGQRNSLLPATFCAVPRELQMVRALCVSCASQIVFTAPKYMIKNIHERQVPQEQGRLTSLQPGAPLIPDKWRRERNKTEANNHHFKSFFALSTSILHRCSSNASSHIFKPLLSCPFSNCRVILALLLALWSERIIHFDKCGCLLRRITH